MSVQTFHDLYIEELRDIYSAEQQLVEALPKMADAAASPKLASAIQAHLEQTGKQIDRLESIFKDLEADPEGHTCVGMKGLLKEGDKMVEELDKGPLRDAAMISGAQRVEHYEMSAYGTARAFAELMGHREHAALLQESLDEETATDSALGRLAEGTINREAAGKQAVN